MSETIFCGMCNCKHSVKS